MMPQDSYVQVNETAFCSPGTLLVAAGQMNGTGALKALDVLSGKSSDTFKSLVEITAHSGSCSSLALDASRQLVALGSSDALTSLWELDELHCFRTLGGEAFGRSTVHNVGFSAASRFVAVASEDLYISIVRTEE